jgi:signal transduction histidine kinase
MSVATKPLVSSSPSRGNSREPVSANLLSLFLSAGVVVISLANGESLLREFRFAWPELLFWALLIVVVNLLPLDVGDMTVTLDMPILLAVALLYPPPVAMLVGVIAAIDVREVEGRVSFLRALFNRSQIGLCVFAGSVVFHTVAGSLESIRQAAWGTAAAIVTFHSANVALVVAHAWLRTRRRQPLSAGGPVQFLLTYIGYGALALVLSRLYTDVGVWSVVTLLIPILVAREALLRAQRLQTLASQLRQRERLLERLFDRMVDERKDERSRISADLHDDVLQSLIRISQLGHFLRKETAPRSEAGKDAEEIVVVSGQAIQELRQVVSDLKTSPLGRGGLVPSLRSLGRDLQLDWRVPVKVDAPETLKLTGPQQLVLYQVAKEAMLNSLQHAEPSSVTVRLGEKDSDVFLEVQDDGRGFSVDSVDTAKHFGLGLIRERVERLGGRVYLTSDEVRGTSLSVGLPREVKPTGSPRSDDS